MTGQALTDSLSQLPALSLSPLPELISFHESQPRKSVNHLSSWAPPRRDAAALMELFRCGKLSATSMMAALC